ncbi:hypothetical protein VKT23_016273 [Stygiomarasmius scandens]|uniref:Uncharacterized protein n=1 Tax=Marasmiellus scandens TaxID=2682957 RepID=A0ABR1IZG0_9AGAR
MILSRVYYSALSIAFPQNNMSFFSNASHFSVHTLTINNVGGNQANSCNDATMHPSISRTDEDEFQVIEQPIRSVPLLTAIAKSISSPSLEVSRQMVLSLLETVARARENKGILLKLTEWTVQVVMSIDDTLRKGNAHLERRHVEALTKSLREVQGCVEEGGQRTWINGSALPRCITSWVSMLEEDLGKILTILNIEKLASLQRLSSMLSSSSLSLVARTIARDDVSLVDEIRRGPDFAVHSVRFDGRFVVLKVFHGSQAGNRLENTLAFSRRFLNPSILNAFATSSSGVPFIVYDECKYLGNLYKHFSDSSFSLSSQS